MADLAVKPKTRVVHCRREAYDVYIGREYHDYKNDVHFEASKWADPFVVGKDGTREECIQKYEMYIRGRPDLLDSLSELKGKRLGCWCAPQACHGDILVKLIEEFL
jgi:hypothetical protein